MKQEFERRTVNSKGQFQINGTFTTFGGAMENSEHSAHQVTYEEAEFLDHTWIIEYRDGEHHNDSYFTD